MSTQSKNSSERLRAPFSTGFLALVILIVAGLAIRSLTNAQGLAILVTALTIALLDPFPIYLNPAGELGLTTVITLPTLVLFGWPAALLGAGVGMAVGFLYRPAGEVFVYGTERLAGLTVAAALVTAFPHHGPGEGVSSVIVAALGYFVIHTLIVSSRMHAEEAIAWPRAVRFLLTATSFHMGVFAAVASVVVWAISNDPSTTTRLLVPMVAAAVTLQIYFPRILRGREQRRVLAAVSVLAAAVDAKDPYTADHSAEVAQLSRRVARILNLDEPEVQRVFLAGLLHDVGKTVVPPSILLKPGKFTDEEWEVMRSHVEAGVRIVESIGGLAEVAPIVAASHEQLDGRGYPLGLNAIDIPIGSRINLVVDAYNALTTNRPYRLARSSGAALQELEAHSGTQFDPRVVSALRTGLGQRQRAEVASERPAWLSILHRPAFALLWFGELVSFIGDKMFFIALTLWVLRLTESKTTLALSLIAATAGQGLLGFFAGALTDRFDRRRVIIASDIGRALLVVAVLFLLPQSIPLGLLLLGVVNVGTVFFRTGVFALIPSIVPREELLTANALFQTTQQIGEIVGSTVAGLIILKLGYQIGVPVVFYLNAISFLVSAVCVGLIPIRWGSGLEMAPGRKITAEIGDGLRFIWQTPIHRILALLIIPGYLTLAFDALQAPMVIETAGLSAFAYGIITGALGVGKLLSSIALSGTGGRRVTVSFIVLMFLVTAIATVLFGITRDYWVLIAAAFLFGVGNVSTNIANATLSMANAPSGIVGRLMASRGVFIAATTACGMLIFGRIADVADPTFALISLGLVSGVGVVIVWLLAGKQFPYRAAVQAPGGGNQ